MSDSKLHKSPSHFVQVVENALSMAYQDAAAWNRIYNFYNDRYLNPDSPERESRINHGYRNPLDTEAWEALDDD